MAQKFKITDAVRAKPTQDFVEVLEEKDVVYERGKDVVEFEPLKDIATAMFRALNQGHFKGFYRNAAGLAHQQVARDHYRFFVLRADIAKKYFDECSVFLNPLIMEEEDEYEAREPCMSHQFRGARKVKRFGRIRAVWWDIERKKHDEWLSGYAAQLFQHEFDHTMGKTVWGDRAM